MDYFNPQTDTAIDWERVDKDALVKLNVARGLAGVPFVITSNYRDPSHSVAVGGTCHDAHTENPCTAFDIQCHESGLRLSIVSALIHAGFTRIGVNNVHVHADCSTVLPQDVFWIEPNV